MSDMRQKSIDALEKFRRIEDLRSVELSYLVDLVIDMGIWDDEAAHGSEDDVMRSLLEQYLPPHALAEVRRMWAANFARWCA